MTSQKFANTGFRFVFVTFVSAFLFATETFAECKMSRDPKSNYFISYEDHYTGVFYEASARAPSPSVIERCQTDAGSYLQISQGVFHNDVLASIGEISYDGTLKDTTCSVKNSLLPFSQTQDQKAAVVAEKHRILRACTYIQIYDLENRSLQFKPNQADCKITRMGDGILRAEGDYCYLKITPMNRFAIATIVKEECKSAEFLKANNIHPQDIEASLNVFIAGDDSGMSTDLTPIGSTRARIYIQPHSKSMPLSEAYNVETPRFPTEYNVDLHMGDFAIRGEDTTFTANMSILANNTARETCHEGFCASSASFDQPVVGEVELREISANGKSTLIDSWWHFGIVHPNWQGLVDGNHTLEETEMRVGTRYQVTVTFVDPYEDFSLFLNAFKQFLIDLKGTQGTAGLDIIASMPGLPQLMGMAGLPGLPSLSGPSMSEEVDRILKSLEKLGKDRQWPAYYDNVCDASRSSCIRAGKVKFFSKLTAEFTLGPIDPMTSVWTMKNVTVSRESPVFGNYKKAVPALPHLSCGAQ